MMELLLRCRYWSVLQVVAIVVCYRGNVLSERAQGCVGSQLSLRCPELKIIQITTVVLGDSNCRGARCCIRDNDCVRDANEGHRNDVHRTCDNKQSCTVGVLTEKISCGYWGAQSNNDFERITYNCINNPQRSTTAKFSIPATTEDIFHTSEKQTENDETTSSTNFQTKENSDRNVNGHDEIGSHEDHSYNSWSTTGTFSTPGFTEDILHTEVYSSEKETENDDTTISTDIHDKEGSDQTANAHDENPTHEDWPYNSLSTAGTFSTPDLTEEIVRTEQNTPKQETYNDDTTSSTDFQTKEGSDLNINGHDENVTRGEGPDYLYDITSSTDFQTEEGSDRNVNGHDENVTHEDRVDNSWSTTATSSRPDSTMDILRTKKNPPEKERKHDDTVISTDIHDKEDSEKYVKGFAAHRAYEDQQGNSWLVPVGTATVCLLVLIAIIVMVAMIRRRRRTTASITVEMADIDKNDRKEAIYANENQTVSRNNGNGSPIYSNDKIKQSRDKGAKASKTYEVPNNAVYSLADDAGSRPTEDPNVLESKEPAYQVPRPRSNGYSVAREVGEPECAGSTADASKVDNNAYCYAEN